MPRGPIVERLPRILLLAASAVGIAVLLVVLASAGGSKTPAAPDRRPATSALTAAAPAAATPAAADAPAPVPAPIATASLHGGAPMVGEAGMMVGIDPETGRPGRPSQAFRSRVAAERSAALDRSSDGLTVVTRPDGSKHVDLQGRFQDYMVVRLTPDGRKIEDCVPGPDVDAALHSEAAPPPALEEK